MSRDSRSKTQVQLYVDREILEQAKKSPNCEKGTLSKIFEEGLYKFLEKPIPKHKIIECAICQSTEIASSKDDGKGKLTHYCAKHEGW